MAPTTLQAFIEEFLANQRLADCSINFEPYHAKVTRRAKRSTVVLASAKDPASVARMADRRTVQDMLDKLVSLSPEMQAWTREGTRRYIPRLYDDVKVLVKPDTLLGDLRNRSKAREEEGFARARRILAKALADCERSLQAWQVNSVLKELLDERS